MLLVCGDGWCRVAWLVFVRLFYDIIIWMTHMFVVLMFVAVDRSQQHSLIINTPSFTTILTIQLYPRNSEFIKMRSYTGFCSFDCTCPRFTCNLRMILLMIGLEPFSITKHQFSGGVLYVQMKVSINSVL